MTFTLTPSQPLTSLLTSPLTSPLLDAYRHLPSYADCFDVVSDAPSALDDDGPENLNDVAACLLALIEARINARARARWQETLYILRYW